MGKFSTKILDCTLRDGGYVIDWMFGIKNIESIIRHLHLAKIDFIECGFLKDLPENTDKTFFKTIFDIKAFASQDINLCLMVNYGEYDISNFPECESKNIKIRVAFKKHNQEKALEYISKLIDLNWDVFVNPMSTNTYSEEELFQLIEKINRIKPYGITIVDTLGNMYEQQVLNIFELIDSLTCNYNKNSYDSRKIAKKAKRLARTYMK